MGAATIQERPLLARVRYIQFPRFDVCTTKVFSCIGSIKRKYQGNYSNSSTAILRILDFGCEFGESFLFLTQENVKVNFF